MPKTIYLPKDATYSGVDVTYTKSTQIISIGGWYDGCVGISGGSMTLEDFFKELGITEKDCKGVFKKKKIAQIT
jgi:hypothetical protein